jgi:hypothetical protein
MRQWWTNATVDEYVNRSACFIEQYSSYRLQEIDGWVREQPRVILVTDMILATQRSGAFCAQFE